MAVLLFRCPVQRWVLVDDHRAVPRVHVAALSSRECAVSAAANAAAALCSAAAGQTCFLAADLAPTVERPLGMRVVVCPWRGDAPPRAALGQRWVPVAECEGDHAPDAFLVSCGLAATLAFCPAVRPLATPVAEPVRANPAAPPPDPAAGMAAADAALRAVLESHRSAYVRSWAPRYAIRGVSGADWPVSFIL